MKDATDYGAQLGDDSGSDGAEWCPSLYWNAPGEFNPQTAIRGEPLVAFINEGRWIVGCTDCGGAQLAALADQRFMCVDCGNTDNGEAWRPVVLPDPVMAAHIVAVLDVRADVTDQSWTPGTTVEDLLTENLTIDTVPSDLTEVH